MEEKILIKSEHYKIKRIAIPAIIALAVLLVLNIVLAILGGLNEMRNEYENDVPYCSHYDIVDRSRYEYDGDDFEAVRKERFRSIHPTFSSYLKCKDISIDTVLYVWMNIDEIFSYYILLFFIVVLAVVYWWLGSYSLTITDKRVYGQTSFGKRVDLPLDSISAVGTSALRGIDAGTSSGRIHFKLIKNRDEIHSELSKLLMERQLPEKQNNIQSNAQTSNADELKKYKELLDSGIITQEEFDAKKKQLLGL